MGRTKLLTGIFLVLALVAAASAKERIPLNVSGTITAEFQHKGYRTTISNSSPFLLAEGQDEGTGLFVLGGVAEFGIVTWKTGVQNPHLIGPLVIAMASAVSDEDFNAWIEDWKKSDVDPTLFIPVSPSTADPINNDQGTSKTWTNEQQATARIFVRVCGDSLFRRYGDLHFDKEAITFVTWTDEQGDSHVEIRADQSSLVSDDGTWASILASCDLKGLPETPTVGTATGFFGTSVRVPHVQGTFPSLVEEVVDRIRSLVFNGTLGEKEAEGLLNDLNKASVSGLQSGKAENTFNALNQFRDSVEQLMQEGVLDLSDSDSLISGVDAIESFVDFLANKLTAFPNPDNFCPEPAGPCPIKEPCEPAILHVREGMDLPNPDGTINNPFPTIVEALHQAGKQMSCAVEIVVGAGAYFGDLLITRDTRIIGPVSDPPTAMIIGGSIVNNGPFSIQIENGTIAADVDGILSDHPCARTILSNVQIIGARGYGIHHRGGVLLANETTVAQTMVLSTFLSAGTGILMTCGARGVFSGVALVNNQSSGLLLAGTATQVIALDLNVTGTRVHPEFANPAIGDPWGGIHVRDEAELVVRGFSIRNNWFYGVRVETGGRANLTGSAAVVRSGRPSVVCDDEFRDPRDPTGETLCTPNEVLISGVADRLEIINGTISTTRAIDTFFPSRDFSNKGGSNAVVGRGSLRLTNFVSTRADVAGLLVTMDGELDLHTGIVSECQIGAGVRVPGYDLSRLMNRVSYTDNGVNLDATELPLPDPSPSL